MKKFLKALEQFFVSVGESRAKNVAKYRLNRLY